LYRNRHDGRAYTLYSNHEPNLLRSAAGDIERIYQAYAKLFRKPLRELGKTSIILQGEASQADITDFAYTPDLLGYYIPLFNCIYVNTIPPWTRQPTVLRQILLHEIAHHFAISCYPRANEECWLNEGLAGNLEMALFDDSRFEYPLVNPSLFSLASDAVARLPAKGALRRLVDSSWQSFHTPNDKQLRYALAWSIVYFILDRHLPASEPLSERIRKLFAMSAEEVKDLEPRWREFLLEEDLTEKLIAMAAGWRDAPLSSAWAIEQLGSLKGLDGARVRQTLVAALECSQPALRLQAAASLIRGGFLDGGAFRGDQSLLVSRVFDLLDDREAPPAVRAEVLSAAANKLHRHPEWIPAFIEILDTDEGELRAVACRGLADMRVKPTIVNPSFWKEADLVSREREIEEWREWWHRQGPGGQ
jgi:hypothetical protein